eukprot:GHUV01048336.1.p2 GENE.GHUV01048336.1~~GHUV01048336.1.p2  ORF type:complete len:189 (+),score=58.83 GHUV01048336.1:420-986(+)
MHHIVCKLAAMCRHCRRAGPFLCRASAEVSAPITYALNINNCVDKLHEGRALRDIVQLSPAALQGLGPKSEEALTALNIKTIAELGTSKYFKAAKAIAVLAGTEEPGKRPAGARSNINGILDKAWETASLQEILAASPSALQGLAAKADEALSQLGIKTIADLANWKYAAWSESLAVLAEYESVDFSS